MKKISSVIIAVIFCGCLAEEKQQRSELDLMVHKIQRCAFWQREYAWDIMEWNGVNADSVKFYEWKKDSVVSEYKFYNRLYDSLIKMFDEQK